MFDAALLAKTIRQHLPPYLHPFAEEMAQIILEAKARSQQPLTGAPMHDVNLMRQMLIALTGVELDTESVQVSFGKGNSFGNITFRDIAGGDIFNIQLTPPHETPPASAERARAERIHQLEGYLQQGRSADAEAVLQALQLEGISEHEYFYWRGRLAQSMGNLRVALAYIEKALRLSPQQGTYLIANVRLLILLGGGLHEPAWQLLMRIKQISPELRAWAQCLEDNNLFQNGPWTERDIERLCPAPDLAVDL